MTLNVSGSWGVVDKWRGCEWRDSLSVCADAIESGLLNSTGEGRVPTQLAYAADSCNLEERLADEGSSMTLDVGGASPVTVDDVSCILNSSEAPQHVRDHIESTRALDGQQEDQWGDGLKARWTYHPDSGLRITFIEEG
ncbi:hypothetical protein [Tessaracoccus massiliensis]|uniref:hypothetical protein n=1 Tax=Tessaracoccus massiliensis TaxID=1522311 RepID=UPI0006945F98|nr:hypothetical protein [Tessaracoccus massiliensis]